MSHEHVDTFFYLKIPIDGSRSHISFYTAIPQNTMDKTFAFIPDLTELERDEYLAIDKECFFCLTITKCNTFKEYKPSFFDEFDHSEEVDEPLYICEDCRERVKAAVEEHHNQTDFPELIAASI